MILETITGILTLVAIAATLVAVARHVRADMLTLRLADMEAQRDAAIEGGQKRTAVLEKEVRRLTDVIIQLKQDGYGAPPWAGNQDEHWGTYAITNEEELAEEERRARAAATEADAGLREELENL